MRTFKDPVSAWTHFIGFLVACVAAVVLVMLSAHDGPKAMVMAVYGATLVGLFLASSLYHFFDLGERGNRWLRRLDHSAIFMLIAGTYLPFLLHHLDGTWRLTMVSVVCGVAITGVVVKVLWIESPAWLGMTLYLGMGWMAVIPGYKIFPQLSSEALVWGVVGGLAYTVGAGVFAVQRPDPWPGRFGHHEIWHLFVLVGAACHYGFMTTLLDAPLPPF